MSTHEGIAQGFAEEISISGQKNNNATIPDSFPVPTYLFFKGDERLGRNDVKVAGQAGKGERKVGTLPDFRAAFP